MTGFFDPRAMESARIALEWKRFGQQMMLDQGLFLEPEVSVAHQMDVFGSVMMRMTANILTDNLPPEKVEYHTSVAHEIPASTWQMWKLRHGKRWYARRLVERWPVTYAAHPDGRKIEVTASINLERFRTYPRAEYRYQEHLGRPVLMHQISDFRWGIG